MKLGACVIVGFVLDSFIEKELADYYSDMLYKVKLTDGSQGFIYVLFEHKSYYDRFVHLQLLEYMVKIWRLHIKQHEEKPVRLPIVIPLLVCHARQEWPENTERLSSFTITPVPRIYSSCLKSLTILQPSIIVIRIMETIISAIFACVLLLSRDKNLLIENLALRQQRRPHVYLHGIKSWKI